MSKVAKEMLTNKENFEKEIKEIFDSMDKDHSNDIDRAEFREFVKSIYKNSGKKINNETIDKFIKILDKDKSGTLSFDEFKEFAVKVLKNYSK